MAFPKKVNIPISTNRVSSHDLSSVHVTTSDFMQFSVAKALELVPRQTIDVRHTLFSRLAPMPLPTFGYANIFNRAYFVPFRTVCPFWNDFITDTPHVYDGGNVSIPTSVPQLTLSSIIPMFVNNVEFKVDADNASADERVDFIYYNYASSTTSTKKRNFTPLGRFAYKLLRSLGYNWTFSSTELNRKFSALPLLAVARVYMDYYYPSAYSYDEESAWVQQLFVYNDSSSNVILSSSDNLARLFKVLYKVCYDSDYFTSAWDNPNGPNNSLYSSLSIPDVNNPILNSVDESYSASSDAYTTYPNPSEPVPSIINSEGRDPLYRITQFSLNALRGLSDYLKRHQISGSRVIDRYLSRFGIKLPDANINRAMFLGEFKQDLQFGDVTSTADTDGAPLGAYSGKGISYGSGNFDYSANEYGMFIIVSVIKPVTGYFENANKHTLHLTKTDFFTPEFDNLGTQALSVREVYNPINGDDSTYDPDKIFGFVPRYAEYKVPYSQVTGDFLCNSINAGMDSWYMMRSLKPYVDSVGGAENLFHSPEFVLGLDSGQFQRIFYNTENNADHFNIIHDFNIKSNFPGKSLYDTYEFENEGESQNVTLPLNGTTH